MAFKKKKQQRYKDYMSDKEFVEWFVYWAERDFEKSEDEVLAIFDRDCTSYLQNCEAKEMERLIELKDEINKTSKKIQITLYPNEKVMRISKKCQIIQKAIENSIAFINFILYAMWALCKTLAKKVQI